MSRRSPPQERNRLREISTVLVAFILTFFLGRPIVTAIGTAPAVAQLAVFAVIYVGLYVLLWRLGNVYWERFS